MDTHNEARVRGQESNLRGNTFEGLCRCRSLLELGPFDTLSLVANGDDVLIRRANGTEEYFEIKHSVSQQLRPNKINDSIQKALRNLRDKPQASWTLLTNTNIPNSDGYIPEGYENRVKIIHNARSLEGLLSQIREDLERKIFAQYPSAKDFLPIGATTSCRNELIRLEAQMKSQGPKEISGAEVAEQTGLSKLLEEVPSYIFSDALHRWGSWRRKARGVSPEYLATRAVLEDQSIERDVEQAETGILQHILQWQEASSESRVLLISGASGTGKTWLLIRLAEQLHKRLNVYWATVVGDQQPHMEKLPKWALSLT